MQTNHVVIVLVESGTLGVINTCRLQVLLQCRQRTVVHPINGHDVRNAVRATLGLCGRTMRSSAKYNHGEFLAGTGLTWTALVSNKCRTWRIHVQGFILLLVASICP